MGCDEMEICLAVACFISAQDGGLVAAVREYVVNSSCNGLDGAVYGFLIRFVMDALSPSAVLLVINLEGGIIGGEQDF